MNITDMNGQAVEVTDLESALSHAKAFVNMQHTDEQYQKLDERLKAYWQDIVNKLEALKENS